MQRDPSVLCKIILKGRKAARSPFGDGVERDGNEKMVKIRIFKAGKHTVRKGAHALGILGNKGYDLVIQRRLHEGAKLFILHTVVDRDRTLHDARGNEVGMAAVQHAHLLLFVMGDIFRKHHVDAVEALLDIVADISLILDRPETEGLADRNEKILVLRQRIEMRSVLGRFGMTGNDTVHQRIAIDIFLCVEGLERLGKPPKVDVAVHTVKKRVRIVIDQLHGKKINAAKTRLESLVKQLRQLRGIGDLGKALDLILGVEADARLGGVGNYDLHLGIGGDPIVRRHIREGIDRLGDDLDLSDLLNGLCPIHTAEHDVIAVVLLFKVLERAEGNGLHDMYRKFAALLVQCIKIVIHKGAKEVTLTELQYFSHFLSPPSRSRNDEALDPCKKRIAVIRVRLQRDGRKKIERENTHYTLCVNNVSPLHKIHLVLEHNDLFHEISDILDAL